MLSKLIITMKREEGINQNAGSLMQGILMEKISSEYAAVLHEGNVNPYSQFLSMKDDTVQWTISALNKEAEKEILRPILEDDEDRVLIKHKDMELKVLGKDFTTMSYARLMDETYFSECSPYVEIGFDSPAAFKVDGAYQFYPTAYHIFQSLIKKYDAFSGEEEIFSDELMNEIKRSLHLTRYNLRSTLFYLEKTRIPAFRGTMCFRVQGSQLFRNLIHMLAAFGEYSGVGIKTAMGMGAMHRKV